MLLATFSMYAQEDAWVYFNDKPNAAAQLATPLNFLTQRALDRRSDQGIALNVNDVPIYQPYIDQITAATGITVKAKSKWMNCLHIRGSVANISALTSLPFVNHVHFADPSLNSRMTTPRPPSNPVNKQMDVQTNFNYGTSNNQIQMLNGQVLHQANYTGTGKIIAVLDSGFINVNTTTPFERLFNNNLILGGYNYVNQSTDVYALHNHGTMTLSCMGGYVDGQLVGTAPDAQYYLFVTEDVSEENPVEESYWVEAAEEADRLGADVISTSLGYYQFDNPNYGHVYADFTGDAAFGSKGANIAFSKGMIVVASAGNSGNSPAPLNHVGVPGEATDVLTVGAVNAAENYAAFSSVGPTFDGRIKPDVMAQGVASVLANTSGTVQTGSGTSFSCPILAGLVTCLWQALPSLTNQQIVNLVKQSADRFANPNMQYGYGIPDFQAALQAGLLSAPEHGQMQWQVFPNPAHDRVTFVIPESMAASSIFLYNNLGQLVLSETITHPSQTLSLEQLGTGIYYFSIPTATSPLQGKIIKK